MHICMTSQLYRIKGVFAFTVSPYILIQIIYNNYPSNYPDKLSVEQNRFCYLFYPDNLDKNSNRSEH